MPLPAVLRATATDEPNLWAVAIDTTKQWYRCFEFDPPDRVSFESKVLAKNALAQAATGKPLSPPATPPRTSDTPDDEKRVSPRSQCEFPANTAELLEEATAVVWEWFQAIPAKYEFEAIILTRIESVLTARAALGRSPESEMCRNQLINEIDSFNLHMNFPIAARNEQGLVASLTKSSTSKIVITQFKRAGLLPVNEHDTAEIMPRSLSLNVLEFQDISQTVPWRFSWHLEALTGRLTQDIFVRCDPGAEASRMKLRFDHLVPPTDREPIYLVIEIDTRTSRDRRPVAVGICNMSNILKQARATNETVPFSVSMYTPPTVGDTKGWGNLYKRMISGSATGIAMSKEIRKIHGNCELKTLKKSSHSYRPAEDNVTLGRALVVDSYNKINFILLEVESLRYELADGSNWLRISASSEDVLINGVKGGDEATFKLKCPEVHQTIMFEEAQKGDSVILELYRNNSVIGRASTQLPTDSSALHEADRCRTLVLFIDNREVGLINIRWVYAPSAASIQTKTILHMAKKMSKHALQKTTSQAEESSQQGNVTPTMSSAASFKSLTSSIKSPCSPTTSSPRSHGSNRSPVSPRHRHNPSFDSNSIKSSSTARRLSTDIPDAKQHFRHLVVAALKLVTHDNPVIATDAVTILMKLLMEASKPGNRYLFDWFLHYQPSSLSQVAVPLFKLVASLLESSLGSTILTLSRSLGRLLYWFEPDAEQLKTVTDDFADAVIDMFEREPNRHTNLKLTALTKIEAFYEATATGWPKAIQYYRPSKNKDMINTCALQLNSLLGSLYPLINESLAAEWIFMLARATKGPLFQGSRLATFLRACLNWTAASYERCAVKELIPETRALITLIQSQLCAVRHSGELRNELYQVLAVCLPLMAKFSSKLDVLSDVPQESLFPSNVETADMKSKDSFVLELLIVMSQLLDIQSKAILLPENFANARIEIANSLLEAANKYILSSKHPQGLASIQALQLHVAFECLRRLSLILEKEYLPPPGVVENFKVDLWRRFLRALCRLSSSKLVSAEKLSLYELKAIQRICGNIREESLNLLLQNWRKLGWPRRRDQPVLEDDNNYGGFQLCLFANPDSILEDILFLGFQGSSVAAAVVGEMLQDMAAGEWALNQHLNQLTVDVLQTLDSLFAKHHSLAPTVCEVIATSMVPRLYNHDSEQTMHIGFSLAVAGLAKQMRECSILLRDFYVAAMPSLLKITMVSQFFKRVGLSDLAMQYLLRAMDKRRDYRTLGLAYLEVAGLFEWHDTQAIAANPTLDLPEQTVHERKRQLYKKAAKSFRFGHQWMLAIDAVKELVRVYDGRVPDYARLGIVHRELSQLYEHVQKERPAASRLYSVKFCGQGFGSLADCMFIFESVPAHRLDAVQLELCALFDAKCENSEDSAQGERILVINTVTVDNDDLGFGADNNRTHGAARFVYTRTLPGSTSIVNMHVERQVYTTATRLPSLSNFAEVVDVQSRVLSPQENALQAMKAKTADLQNILQRHKAGEKHLDVHLELVLSGAVNSPINGGIAVYKPLLDEAAASSSSPLISAYSKLVDTIQESLIVYESLMKPSMRKHYETLVQCFNENLASDARGPVSPLPK